MRNLLPRIMVEKAKEVEEEMFETITGCCLCGAVRFEIENSFEKLYLCHCTQCQKISGSIHVSNLFGSTDTFRWLSGERNIQRYDYPERGFTNAFCGTCGCGVPYLNQRGTAMVVRSGTLSGEPRFSSLRKIFYSERAEWIESVGSAIVCDAFPT